MRNKYEKESTWLTKAGTFTTNKKCKVQVTLPEFDDNKIIEYEVHVDDSPDAASHSYDMIMGCDLMAELGIKMDFGDRVMTWNGITAPMKSRSDVHNEPYMHEQLESVIESYQVQELTERMSRILDADYHKADINKVTSEAVHLTPEEQKQLNFLLKRYEYLFDGQLGKWRGKPVDFELQARAKPYHAKAFLIPQSLEAATKKECERLCKIGVLRKVNDSEWATQPSFDQRLMAESSF